MSEPIAEGPQIRGDVNIQNGDLVGGDKTIGQGDAPHEPSGGRTIQVRKPGAPAPRRIDGNIQVEGGDLVLGDKIIKLFRKIYVFKDLRQLALFLGVVLVVTGAIAGAAWYLRQPRKMTGNFNIAVASFGEIQSNGQVKPSAQSETISSSLFNFLDSEYQASSLGLNVQVEHHNMPLVIEEAQAQQLAKKVNADIVIYGTVAVSGDQAELSPRFYVSDRPDTKELTGQNDLALPIDFTASSLKSQEQVNTELRVRAAVLFNFTKALIYFSQNNQDPALRCAQAAIAAAAEAPAPFGGEEVLYLLEAKIHMSQQDYGDASRELQQALKINPQYARAHLGLGNIYLAQAQAAGYDPKLLAQALAEYTAAYEMPTQPEGAYIPIKAHTAMGDVLMIQAQQTGEARLYAQATDNFTYVIDQYTQTQDPFLRPFAADAWYGLGALQQSQDHVNEARQDYQKAIDLAEDAATKLRVQQQMQTLSPAQ